MNVVHRLGLVLCVVTGLGWFVHEVAVRRRERALLRRLNALLEAVTEKPAGRGVDVRGAIGRWGPSAGAVCAGYVLVGGVAGLLLGLVAAFGVWRWRRRARAAADGTASSAAQARRQLPLAADLLAACIAAGADPVRAARAVGESLGGPVGEVLARGAAQVRLGGEPRAAWRQLASMPGAGALAGLLERAGDSGAPAAEPVARLAAEARAERGRATTAVARRAAVLITAPVGLCFLPAFVAIGVLPVVIGVAGGLLGGR
ncbi:type II secretion system F family protein [Streptomyces sp. NBC_01003]|uniref:type II secretion system F family protein n=1 Tax=Streptomyces sp. NBC_01003 TaxID=2903714 RepID=UPI003868DF20|nr:type II secretion system F family protein [Streptomyces sp. NBC_01003]